MKLKFWGTRGSCAAPFANRNEFGGNTSCAALREGNCWLVLDGGTGIIPLAAEIREAAAASDAETCRVRILISHFHLDHITGLPMFLAALPKTAEVTLYAVPNAEAGERPYAEELVSLIGPPLWPIRLTDVCSQLRFADLDHTQENDIGDGIVIRTLPSNHPNNRSIYRITWQGRDVVYGLDYEITDAFEEAYVSFAKGCDCLLYDGAYTDEDYPRCVGFGHSAFSRSVAIAEKTAAKRVYVMHYDYKYTDDLLLKAEAATADNKRVFFAREGQCIDL